MFSFSLFLWDSAAKMLCVNQFLHPARKITSIFCTFSNSHCLKSLLLKLRVNTDNKGWDKVHSSDVWVYVVSTSCTPYIYIHFTLLLLPSIWPCPLHPLLTHRRFLSSSPCQFQSQHSSNDIFTVPPLHTPQSVKPSLVRPVWLLAPKHLTRPVPLMSSLMEQVSPHQGAGSRRPGVQVSECPLPQILIRWHLSENSFSLAAAF